MPLIVEDGTGLPNADSYVSVADFVLYCDRMGHTDEAVIGAGIASKEVMLRRGFIFLDGVYGPRVSGVRLNFDQSGVFPREHSFFLDGRPVTPNTVPQIWRDAQCEAAILGLQGTSLVIERTAGGRVKRERIDVIETEWFDEAHEEAPVFGWIDAILASLVPPREDVDAIQIGRIARA